LSYIVVVMVAGVVGLAVVVTQNYRPHCITEALGRSGRRRSRSEDAGSSDIPHLYCDGSLRCSNKCLGLRAFKLGLWATQRVDGKLNVAQQGDFQASKNHAALQVQGLKASGRIE